MKIRTAKDVERLDRRIKDELGIDIQKYRNEEVVENFVELLIFPKYVVTSVIRPILLAILIFLIGFFILDLVHIEFLIYGSIGFVLFLATGILTGLLFITWKMKSDLWGIMDYSLEIMKSAVGDIHQVNDQLTKENRKEVLELLFNGVIHLVTIPMMSKVISDKVPLVGGFVNKIMKKVLILLADKVTFDEETFQQESSKEGGKSNTLQAFSNAISSVSAGLEKVINITFRIAQLPLKMVFGILAVTLILFLYLIN